MTRLAEELGVSDATIREDISWLAEGMIEQFHGGARLTVPGGSRHPYSLRSRQAADEKDLIAAFAAENYIKDGDYLLLDGGTQMEAFVRALSQLPRSGIRAVSQAGNFAMHFLSIPEAEYVQLGGLLDTRTVLFADSAARLNTGTFFTRQAEQFLQEQCQKLPFKAVATASAFSCEKGMTAGLQVAVQYKRLILNAAAEEVIYLVDSHKFAANPAMTITWCGLKPDGDWLGKSKKAIVIVDWKEPVPAELKRFAAHPAVEEEPLGKALQKKYPAVKVFRTRLRGEKD